MADGRHFKQPKDGHISAKVQAIDTKFGTLVHIGPLNRSISKKNQLLKFQDGGWRHLEKLKTGHVSAMVRPIGTKFGLMTHIGPPNWQLKFPTF